MTEDELRRLRERNSLWAQEIRDYVYPIPLKDIAGYVGKEQGNFISMLNGRQWLYPEVYEQIMSIDIGVLIDVDPEIKRRTEKRLRKIVEEAPKAAKALEKYFS